MQDDFLDAVHDQTMESHKEPLAEVGVEIGDISPPDLCLVGVYLGEVGDINIGKRCNFHAGVNAQHGHARSTIPIDARGVRSV